MYISPDHTAGVGPVRAKRLYGDPCSPFGCPQDPEMHIPPWYWFSPRSGATPRSRPTGDRAEGCPSRLQPRGTCRIGLPACHFLRSRRLPVHGIRPAPGRVVREVRIWVQARGLNPAFQVKRDCSTSKRTPHSVGSPDRRRRRPRSRPAQVVGAQPWALLESAEEVEVY